MRMKTKMKMDDECTIKDILVWFIGVPLLVLAPIICGIPPQRDKVTSNPAAVPQVVQAEKDDTLKK